MQYIAMMARRDFGGDTILHRVGGAVRVRREQAGITVRELARRSGLSQRFVAMVEAGQGNISLTRLSRLAQALDATAAELLVESERGKAVRQVALLGLRGAGKSTLGARVA